jgi:molybdopterin/thiamine biosynthesis adenylyltransferase
VTERLDRQSFLGSDSDTVLKSLRVGVVGLGGGGSHIVQQLAHIGVGQYVVADPDVIEASNLNRLVGATATDVRNNTFKTRIAARQIRRVLPSASIVRIERRWQLDSISLRDCDILFGCVDSFGERRQLEEAARRYLIPYIDMGMDVLPTDRGYAIVGQVALSMPGLPCLRCMGVIRDSDVANEAQAYGTAGAKPQVVWPNGVLASVAVGIAVELVCPWFKETETPILTEYDGNANTLGPSGVLAHLPPSCPHFCGGNSIGDPWFERRQQTICSRDNGPRRVHSA